jgi:RHS repeat-associated protein
LYSGEQFDSKIGQQYLRQRYYDPAIGRFNRLDLFFGNLDDPQSLHKYLYTHADPINGIDPTGLESLYSVSVSTGVSSGMRDNSQAVQMSSFIRAKSTLTKVKNVIDMFDRFINLTDQIQDLADIFLGGSGTFYGTCGNSH